MPDLSRRAILKFALGGAAGLVLGVVPQLAGAQPAELGPFMNAWLRIAPDESITLIVDRSEMGQGVYTALPMLVAEELECEWSRIRVVAAPADPVYRNLFLVREMLTGGSEVGDTADWFIRRLSRMVGQQITGGSTSVRGGFRALRVAGAAAREMLVATAARQWDVSPAECKASNGVVLLAAGGRALSYGALAPEAAKLDPPRRPAVKAKAEWRLLGQPVPRLDVPAKIDGSAGFGIDARPPDLLFAAIARAPAPGGRLAGFDRAAALARRGVKAVVDLPDGIAVVADNSWRAQQTLEDLPPRWDDGPNAALATAEIEHGLRAALAAEGRAAETAGDVATALAAAAKRVGAEYEVPYLAHATMEPMNATARIGADGVDLWIPTQAQEAVANAAAKAAGVAAAKVRVHTTYLGGGFGRRLESDLAEQAVLVAKAVGRPVQVLWSRAEDMTHDFYRPAAACRLEAGLDADGALTAWNATIACPSIMARVLPAMTWLETDRTAVEGALRQPYAVANRRIGYVQKDFALPVGFWRSVGHSQNAFFKECFLDEVAAAAGADPLDFRRRHLAQAPRELALLDFVAAKAGWRQQAPPGLGRGIALHASFGSIVAMVAEVAVAAGEVKVRRILAAIDCGMVVNPAIVKAQVEGAIVFGLTATLYGRITVEGGRVQERHFDDYPMLRLAETPEIEVYVTDSDAAPGGAGEPAVPTVAPAVVNAVHAATGKRIRRLPLAGQDLNA